MVPNGANQTPGSARTAGSADPADVLGVYLLPGRVDDPRLAIEEAATAERIGLGSVWISERWDTKQLGVVAGAVSQVTQRVRIVAGTTHFGTRHPLVLAGLASTMDALSGGRFVLGIGRGGAAAKPVLREYGGQADTNAALRDHATILRRIWSGDQFSYDGPAGSYGHLGQRDATPGARTPLLLAAIGDRALEVAGTHFDGVILAPFVTPAGVRRSAQIARNAAADAGRDPAEVRIHALVIVAPDLSPADQAVVVGGRAVTYFQDPGTARRISRVNGWDAEVFEPLWNHRKFSGPGAAGNEFRNEDLVEVARLLPGELLSAGAAIGSASQCAAGLQPFLDAGADELVLHATTAEKCGGLVDAFRNARR